VRAGDDLHLGKHPRERLGVPAPGHRGVVGPLDAGHLEVLVEHDVDLGPGVVGARELGLEGPEPGQAGEQPAP
jgi:hypothetical protein